jgi:EAL domain-containing protein (putative c-di-GMP-specific phosphodiesterase class I)
VERQSIEESLRRALERQEFALHYQPKLNLKTGAITGAEALLRWTHPERGPITPAQFIPVAEDCGLILPIGRWVLRHAAEQAQAWVDAGLRPVTMAVNVSAMEFRDEDFLICLFQILGETRLNPRALELELTESVLMKRAASTALVLQTLRKCGVQVAIDDFGTGLRPAQSHRAGHACRSRVQLTPAASRVPAPARCRYPDVSSQPPWKPARSRPRRT